MTILFKEMTNGTTINPITGYEFNGPMGIALSRITTCSKFHSENNTNGLGPLNVQFT